MSGLRRVWYRGARKPVTATDNGREVVIRGKNGGPVIRQSVVLHLVPKESS